MMIGRIAVAGLALLLGAVPAGAAIEGSSGDFVWSVSGEVRLRPEWRDDADLKRGEDDDRREGLMRLRLGVGVTVREEYRLFAQAQDSRVAGEEASTSSNERNLDLHQGFVEIRRLGLEGLSLTAGRQELKIGDERLIGAFGWDNVGRSFDAAKLTWSREKGAAEMFAARVTSRAPGGATAGSDLYGIVARCAARPGAEYEMTWLLFDDALAAPGETGRPGPTRVNALGFRAKDTVGRLDLTAEVVVERGEFRGDDLSAHAAALQAGCTWGGGEGPEAAPRVRVFAGYDHATGDEDPADGEREEFFNFFPTNHMHYGYADYEGWRNLRSPYAGVSVTSGRHFGLVKAHRFGLDEPRGPWKSAGGAVLGFDPDGRSGRAVGAELDLLYRYRWRESATVEAGYARFEPGRFARRTRGPDASDWAYVMATFGF